MENKPNQPTPGSTSSQATGTSKTTSSAATPQSGSPTPQGPTDRTKTPSAASANPQASSDTSSADTTARTGSQTQPLSRDQQGLQSTDKKEGSQTQSWMNVSSWLDGTNQVPQSVKDLGTKALDQVNKLTTTQKVVGGALLVSGLSWLALRSKSQSKSSAADYRSNTDYRSRTYGSRGTSADQKFQGPYGNSPTRGISDDYPTKSSTDYRNGATDSGYRSGSTRSDVAGTSGFGESDYSSDL